MAFWHRVSKTKLKSLSIQLSRYHIARKASASLLDHTVIVSRPHNLDNPFSNFRSNARFFTSGKFVKKEDSNQITHRLNDQITARFVRLVTDEGHNVVSLREAMERAKKLELDLVEVDKNADPPVCRLMDFHKEKYERNRKAKERAKTKSELTLRKGSHKEVRFSEKTEQKDLQIKADLVKRLMEDRYRVKCMVVTLNKKAPAKATNEEDLQRIREEEERQKAVMAEVLSRLTALIEDEAVIESGPHVEKRQAYVIVRHVKFGPPKKGGAKKNVKKQVNSQATEEDGLTDDDAADGYEFDEVFKIGDATKGPSADHIKASQRNFDNNQARYPGLPPPAPPPSIFTENRYKRPDPRTQFPPTNRHSDHRDSSRSQYPNQRGPSPYQSRQAGPDSPAFRDLNPNEKPKQEPASSGTRGNTASGFGIFSTSKGGDVGKQGAGTETNRNGEGNRYSSPKKF